MSNRFHLLAAALLAALAVGAAIAQDDPAPTTSPSAALPSTTAPGLRVQLYQIDEPMAGLMDLAPDQTPNAEMIVSSLDLQPADFGELTSNVRTVVTATLPVAEEELYIFDLSTDDGGGAAIYLDGELLVRTEGDTERGYKQLKPGDHAIRIDHYHGNGGEPHLAVTARAGRRDRNEDGSRRLLVPLGGEGVATTVDATLTPVVSAGPKRLLADTLKFRPGDTVPLDGVHPAFKLATIRPPEFQPQVGALAVLPGGRLAMTTFQPLNNGVKETEPNGVLWVLSGVDQVKPEDGLDGFKKVTITKAAEGLFDPIGMVAIGERLIITETDQLTELLDADGDGIYEGRKKLGGDWASDNYHHFTFGPAIDPNDAKSIYVALSAAVYLNGMRDPEGREYQLVSGGLSPGLNGPNPPNRGSVAKINTETGEVEYIAGGFRTPNGMLFGPGGQLFVTENQGGWMPANKLNHVKPGHFYGYHADLEPWLHYPQGGSPVPFQDQPFTPPALYLPQNQIANSPTQPVMIPDDERFGPYAGQMLLGELTKGGLRRAVLEEVDGWYQGVAFRFSQGFEAGVNRLAWADDHSLYVGMTGYRGNWTWRETTFGLQKLVPTGEIAFEMLNVSATPDGFVVTFTKPADTEYLRDVEHYEVRTWTYEPSPEYGGPSVDEHELKVESAEVAEDGLSVRLRIPGLKAGYVVHLRTDPRSQAGERMWTTEAWYTLNRIPKAAAAAH